MNHDYTHCIDYDDTCPKTCFRAELAKDLEKRKEEFVGIPLSFSHLKGTFLCDKSFDRIAKGLNVREVVPCDSGTWVERDHISYCSECGKSAITESNFCPNCGVRMRQRHEIGVQERRTKMTLAERLCMAMKNKGMKQKDVAEALGVTQATINRYINNERSPRADVIVKLSDLLGVTTDWLLKGDSNGYERGWNDALNAVQDVLKRSAIEHTDCAWR